jgi:hypothetical protein
VKGGPVKNLLDLLTFMHCQESHRGSEHLDISMTQAYRFSYGSAPAKESDWLA